MGVDTGLTESVGEILALDVATTSPDELEELELKWRSAFNKHRQT